MVRSSKYHHRLARRDYYLTLLSVPGLKGTALIRAAESRLRELYPGNIEECLTDYRLLKGEAQDFLLTAILPESRAGYRSIYIPLFHGIDRKLPHPGGRLVISESGLTDILSRSAGNIYELSQLKGADAEDCRTMLCGASGYRGAFGGRQKSWNRQLPGLLMLTVMLSASVLGMLDIRDRRNELAELKEQAAARITRYKAETALRAKPDHLTPAEELLPEVPSPTSLLTALADTLPAGSVLTRFDYSAGDEAVVELIGDDALSSIEKLVIPGNHDLILTGDIRPLSDGSGRELYHLQLVRVE